MKTKLAITFEKSCVSTGSRHWLGPVFPNTRSSSPAPEFLPQFKKKKKKKKGNSYHSLCVCIYFFPNNSECHQVGLAAVLAKPQTYEGPTWMRATLPPRTGLQPEPPLPGTRI